MHLYSLLMWLMWVAKRLCGLFACCDRFLLMGPTAPFKKEDPPLVVALDSHASLSREFLAGTTGCDIWEVSAGRTLPPNGKQTDLINV